MNFRYTGAHAYFAEAAFDLRILVPPDVTVVAGSGSVGPFTYSFSYDIATGIVTAFDLLLVNVNRFNINPSTVGPAPKLSALLIPQAAGPMYHDEDSYYDVPPNTGYSDQGTFTISKIS